MGVAAEPSSLSVRCAYLVTTFSALYNGENDEAAPDCVDFEGVEVSPLFCASIATVHCLQRINELRGYE